MAFSESFLDLVLSDETSDEDPTKFVSNDELAVAEAEELIKRVCYINPRQFGDFVLQNTRDYDPKFDTVNL
jgi:hypothetical protein